MKLQHSSGECLQIVIAPSGEGKSVLDRFLHISGHYLVAGPVHTDTEDDFAQAAAAAHSVEDCLPNLHDAILDTTGRSLSDDDLRRLVKRMPQDVRLQIDEWGLSDTEVLQLVCSTALVRSLSQEGAH